MKSMRSLGQPSRWLRVAIILVGAVVLLAGYQKLIGVVDLSPLLQFVGVPSGSNQEAALALGFFELIWGAAIVWFQLRSQALLWVSSTILLCFSALIAMLLFDSKAPSCGCVTLIAAFEDARSSNLLSLTRNAVMLLVTVAGALTVRADARMFKRVLASDGPALG